MDKIQRFAIFQLGLIFLVICLVLLVVIPYLR